MTTDPEVDVDLDRAVRCGFPEVVYCEGKSPESVVAVFHELSERGQHCFGTRASEEHAAALLSRFPELEHNPVARTLTMFAEREPEPRGEVAVITAGTTDRPVAEEAIETLRWMGVGRRLIQDVGVAGPHRLPARLEEFRSADAVVVVAGMEGALPSVVGGYVDVPVIAVPTSVGYGTSFEGVTALLGMMNSCASNVTVVNIDGGFKGGYVAGLIASRSAGR